MNEANIDYSNWSGVDIIESMCMNCGKFSSFWWEGHINYGGISDTLFLELTIFMMMLLMVLFMIKMIAMTVVIMMMIITSMMVMMILMMIMNLLLR